MLRNRTPTRKAAAPRWATPPRDPQHPRWQEIDRLLPPDHLARRVARTADELDLRPLRGAYAGRGSRAQPPLLLLKVALFELAQGRLSPAQWARDCRDCDSLKWLTFGLRPSRTCPYAFRDRLGPHLDALNRQVLERARAEGYTPAGRGAVDGTFGAALGSRHRLVNRATLDKRRAQLDAATAADQAGTAAARPGWMAATPAGRARQQAAYRRADERLRELEGQHRKTQPRKAKRKRRPAERVVVCPSEPEAALGVDKQKVFRPLYDVQLVCDLDSPFVLGYGTYAAVSDAGLLGPSLERVRVLTGVLPEAALADGIYASVLDLLWCQQRGVVLYAPVAEAAGAEPAAAGRPPAQIPKGAFTWLPGERAYRCPEGHVLGLDRVAKEQRQGCRELEVLQFRCPAEHCQGCPRQPSCTRTPERGRTIKRSAHEELVEALRARMAEPASQELYKLRKQTIELRFADRKGHRGLRQFRSYGLERAGIQVGLLVLAHNAVELQ